MRRAAVISAAALVVLALPVASYAATTRSHKQGGVMSTRSHQQGGVMSTRSHQQGGVMRTHGSAHRSGHHGGDRGSALGDLFSTIIESAIDTAAEGAGPGMLFIPVPGAAGGGYYVEQLVSPYDSAYDRVMTAYMRSSAVTGYRPVGVPELVVGAPPATVQVGEAVFRYDGLTGKYIQLAQADAHRALPPPAPPPR
jgi:hypothetical protein